VKYWKEKDIRVLFLFVVFLLTIALTYSRAGFLALIGGSFVSFLVVKDLKKFLLFVSLFLLMVISLPRPGGEGVKLERTASVILRIEDYQDTLTIFKKSPLFGVGYNNMCFAREKYLGEPDLDSHACSGSASSLLLVLATTGTVGFLMFLTLIYKMILNLNKNMYGLVFLSCLTALFIHSLFVNSLFYPWVMGWMGLLLAISLKPSKE
jgi:O-antigen ligase